MLIHLLFHDLIDKRQSKWEYNIRFIGVLELGQHQQHQYHHHLKKREKKIVTHYEMK